MTDGNEMAFARPAYQYASGSYDQPSDGMTKREYFAALAMQGLCSNPHYTNHVGWYEDLKMDAVQQADNLIAELNRGVK